MRRVRREFDHRHGRWNASAQKYACSRRFNRGGCENDLYIRPDDLEDLLHVENSANAIPAKSQRQ
jgi:hypothetical protein